VVRSILTVAGSQIIHDPSKELFYKTSGALVEKNSHILQLDFSSPKTSLRFNPIF
jgi:type IV secretory pathway TraG/TraD family ATPase VirD4